MKYLHYFYYPIYLILVVIISGIIIVGGSYLLEFIPINLVYLRYLIIGLSVVLLSIVSVGVWWDIFLSSESLTVEPGLVGAKTLKECRDFFSPQRITVAVFAGIIINVLLVLYSYGVEF